jgi:diacylglycerol kinase (ATP)
MPTKLIVNPYSNKGRALALLPRLTTTLRQLGVEFDLSQTTGPGHATELAQQAVAAGYERVVAVGGDGTCHEAANGLLTAPAGRAVSLGVIPTGSGNDWAYALQIPTDVSQACQVLQQGSAKAIDVGRVTVDGQARFFVNGVGMGLDAEVTVDTKRPSVLRGFAMYLSSVFRVIASGRWPYLAQFSFNDQSRHQLIILLAIGNGPRSGGGFLLTPQARLDDGLFDICYAAALSRFNVLKLLPKSLHGTHIYDSAITIAQTTRLEVVVEAGVPAHVDGEILCINGRHFEFEILPQALQVWN